MVADELDISSPKSFGIILLRQNFTVSEVFVFSEVFGLCGVGVLLKKKAVPGGTKGVCPSYFVRVCFLWE